MVKTVKGLDSKLYSMEYLARAYLYARKGKTSRREVIEADADPMGFLSEIHQEIVTHTYVPGPYTEYDKFERGKLRHISYEGFKDQVVHWLWKLVVEPEINSRLISQTYASIKGRGQHAAVDKVKEYMEEDPEGTRYCLEFDVAQCFKSISADVVMRKFRRKFSDPGVLWLTSAILHGYHEGRELPLGNVTSHPLANFVLDDVDRVIKDGVTGMRAARYIRYLDNGWVLARSKPYLRRVRDRVTKVLESLGLRMKSNWQIYPVDSRGANVLGFRIFHDFSLVSKKTKKRMKRCMSSAIAHLKAGLDPTPTEIGQHASYKGHLSHCNSWRLSKLTIRLFERLWKARTWMQSLQHRTHAPSSS